MITKVSFKLDRGLSAQFNNANTVTNPVLKKRMSLKIIMKLRFLMWG